MGSGCSPFYNTDKEGEANTEMKRFFDEDYFEIFATRKLQQSTTAEREKRSLRLEMLAPEIVQDAL